jgi:transcriptional regulator with XRE-family HTH domain
MPTPRVKHPDIVRIFAKQLRSLRLARGMTQRDVAEQARVTVTYVSTLEAAGAAPGIDLVERLAHSLDVPVSDLLPTAAAPPTMEANRQELKRLMDSLLQKAGPDTLQMLKHFCDRLAESRSLVR